MKKIMTQKELHLQRLVNEANRKALHFYSRRHFIKESAMGFGALALGSMLPSWGLGSSSANNNIVFDPAHPLEPKLPMFPGKAKRVIYLHIAEPPSQLELLYYTTDLMKLDGHAC